MVIAGAGPGAQLRQRSFNRMALSRHPLGNLARAVFAKAEINCTITAHTAKPANLARGVLSEPIWQHLTPYLAGREPAGFAEPELGY